MAPIKVLVADAEPLFAEVLGTALRRDEDLDVAPTYPGTGARAVQAIADLRPDVALVDVRLPGMRGFALATAIHRESPETKVVVTAADPSPRELEEIAVAGVWASADKALPLGSLVHVIRSAAKSDDEHVDPALLSLHDDDPAFDVNKLAACDHRSDDEKSLLPVVLDLSPRQLEVLDLLRAGRSIPQIATVLRISPTTVRTHVQALRARTGARSQAEAVAIGRRSGYLDDSSGRTSARANPRRRRRQPHHLQTAPDSYTRRDLVRVLVVASEWTFADALIEVLANTGNVSVPRCTGWTADYALELVRTHAADVVVVKLGIEGLDIRSLLGASRDPIAVVVVGTRGGPLAVNAFTDGATAYVSDDASISDLVEAIRRAHRGERYVADPGMDARPRTSPALSARDRVVLGLLDGGLSAKQVANQLSVSVATVRSAIQRLMLKFDAHSRVELIAVARAGGVLPSQS